MLVGTWIIALGLAKIALLVSIVPKSPIRAILALQEHFPANLALGDVLLALEVNSPSQARPAAQTAK